MKKLLSIALALVLILSMSIVASAEEVTYAATEATSFNITKTYTSDENFVPGETLKFDITADSANPDTTKLITIGDKNEFTVKADTTTQNITVSVPSYGTAGVYRYTIVEKQGNTAGVTVYDTTKKIHVVVLVEYDNTNKKLVIGNGEVNGITCYIENVKGSKTSEFENEFHTNDFSVAKNVEGNMANLNDKFEITVTLTSSKPVLTPIKVGGVEVAASSWTTEGEGKTYTYTTTLNLSEADGATYFADIPYGVNVSVVETTDAGKMSGYTCKGYTLGEAEKPAASASFEIGANSVAKVVVENEKDTPVDTGITMDSMPYVLLLAVACFGMVVLFSKKRMMREN